MRATFDHTDGGATILVRVWLDERRKVAKDDPRLESDDFTAAAGEPDPDYVREWAFGADPPETGAAEVHDGDGEPPMRKMSDEEYLEQIRAEVKLLAEAELAALRAAPAEVPLTDLAAGEKL